jgi:hypothetical protein
LDDFLFLAGPEGLGRKTTKFGLNAYQSKSFAELVGSNPTQFVYLILGIRIKLSSFQIAVVQDPPTTTFYLSAIWAFAG